MNNIEKNIVPGDIVSFEELDSFGGMGKVLEVGEDSFTVKLFLDSVCTCHPNSHYCGNEITSFRFNDLYSLNKVLSKDDCLKIKGIVTVEENGCSYHVWEDLNIDELANISLCRILKDFIPPFDNGPLEKKAAFYKQPVQTDYQMLLALDKILSTDTRVLTLEDEKIISDSLALAARPSVSLNNLHDMVCLYYLKQRYEMLLASSKDSEALNKIDIKLNKISYVIRRAL